MKLSLDALKERAEAVASEELLANITGGVANACHDKNSDVRPVPSSGNSLGDVLFIIFGL